MAQRVFVTGGTGFVGKAVIRALLAQGFLVRCLVRPGSEHDLKGFESIDRVPGDVLQPDGLAASVEGCSALVHLVGIIREQRGRGVTFDRLHTQATRNMLALARAAGIKRFAQMSALGARPGARARYHQTKWEAEEAVRASDLEWTIFRPSIIFGRGDAFMSVLGRAVKRLPVMPVLGDGRYRLQPIPVEQVAQGFGRALRTPESVRQTYEVAGPTPYAFVDLLDEIGRRARTPARTQAARAARASPSPDTRARLAAVLPALHRPDQHVGRGERDRPLALLRRAGPPARAPRGRPQAHVRRAMSEWPLRGAFPHQHGDARGLMERIQAQLRERIEEAVEMAALKLMVDLRAATGRPAPESTSTADRAEFEAGSRALLAWLRDVYVAELPPDLRPHFDEAEAAAGDEPARLLAGQVWLARRLPDYWQRFERYQRQYAEQRLADPGGPGWLKRLFG